MKIFTLTLNPAFDVHCLTDKFETGRESFFEVLSKEACGKGINISRALCSAGVENSAVVVAGRDNSDEFDDALTDVDDVYFSCIDGRIRENFILHDKTGVETRVSFNGAPAPKRIFDKVEETLETFGVKINGDTVVTFTGSLPVGIGTAAAKRFVKKLKSRGAKVVLDCRSFTLADILELKPFLIKPNRDELSGYIGREVRDISDMKNIAEELYKKGVENALISAGADGAVLANADGVFYKKPPEIKAASTIGAGDSMIAGFLYAYMKGEKGEGLIKYAVAFGAAACLREGTLPPEMKDVERIYAAL